MMNRGRRQLFDQNISSPNEWKSNKNPPYTYYVFFLYSNLAVLNQFRQSKGMNTVAFRPHSGESGSPDHLVASYLCVESIAHGVQLIKAPVIRYLFLICEIGVSMSPKSNNRVFRQYSRNPLPEFFSEGLRVAISTDDPLLFHLAKDSLMEEFSCAETTFNFSTTDQCEMAKNSVLISGFPSDMKKE